MEAAKLALQLIQSLIWPAFGLFLVLVYREKFGALLDRTSVQSVKVPGLEIDLSARLASATSAGIAIGKKTSGPDQQDAGTAVRTVAKALASTTQANSGLRRSTILWVDDVPANNTDLVDAFRLLGYQVTLARSTDEAMAELASTTSPFDLVISDMVRERDPDAGLTLAKVMRESGFSMPMIIFAASWAAQHRGEEGQYGFARITNDTSEVYATVVGFMSGGTLPPL